MAGPGDESDRMVAFFGPSGTFSWLGIREFALFWEPGVMGLDIRHGSVLYCTVVCMIDGANRILKALLTHSLVLLVIVCEIGLHIYTYSKVPYEVISDRKSVV